MRFVNCVRVCACIRTWIGGCVCGLKMTELTVPIKRNVALARECAFARASIVAN